MKMEGTKTHGCSDYANVNLRSERQMTIYHNYNQRNTGKRIGHI